MKRPKPHELDGKPCPTCGAAIRAVSGPGRTTRLRGQRIEIPEWITTYVCDCPGSTWWTQETAETFDREMEKSSRED